MKEYAYKMFNANLTCTLGHGVFQYEPDRWYEENDANCRRNGFHSAKNPLDCLTYYHSFEDSQCWQVEIGGDVDEDDCDSKVSSTRIRLVKRLSLPEFVAHALLYIIGHPKAPMNSLVMYHKPAVANNNGFAISVGPDARAMGNKIGDVVGIIQHTPRGEILAAGAYEIDGKKWLPHKWYNASGEEVAV